ncbi:hypothetical protein [Hazenella coriacea]|uniref:Uncharacterized protein n=1 Tax=Hazenella coriacea TaxID=1179467 RepID=A0A4R3L1I5_9BACL|nr:hypothetical protein [Hazenella coriacea]TCS93431.1 hypothetical protein EDD58_10778 [Hazenella coriacea]
MEIKDLKHTISTIQSELNQIETMAGTLSTIEREHYNLLTRFDHSELVDIAVEEQSGSRQLGTMKQLCLSISQKLEGIHQAIDQDLEGVSNCVQDH